MAQPWEKYRVGALSTSPNWTEPTCQPLDTVAHVAHVATAKRVIEDESLRADLVYDDSILNKRRIRVVWLSPNHWVDGFRYGNVRFHLDWDKLVAGKRCYWVEAMTQYHPTACRILVTSTDYSGRLSPYDPTAGDGPWWKDADGNHFWNGTYCLEVMHDGNIPVEAVKTLDFVDHHRQLCNAGAGNCPYHDVAGSLAGAEFVAWILSSRHADRVDRFSDHFAGAASRLLHRCSKVEVHGPGMSATDGRADAAARAFLGALFRHDGDKQSLANLFDSTDSLVQAVECVFTSDFANGAELIE